MYNLNIFDVCHIQPTWNDIYFGVRNKFLDLESVREYAIRCLESNNDYSEEITELAWPNDDILNVIEIIEKILDKEHDKQSKVTSIKWQYCIIKSLLNERLSFEELSSKLDVIYADFNYPEDMEEFISYMPIKDDYNPTEHTKEENEKRILKKVYIFLDRKKDELNG